MCNDLHHCLVELLVADHIILVAVNLGHDLIPELVITLFKSCLASGTMENGAKFLLADHTIAILVKKIKGNTQILSIEQPRPVDSCSDEFAVVDFTVVVSIELAHQIAPILTVSCEGAKDLAHALLQLIKCEEAILR